MTMNSRCLGWKKHYQLSKEESVASNPDDVALPFHTVLEHHEHVDPLDLVFCWVMMAIELTSSSKHKGKRFVGANHSLGGYRQTYVDERASQVGKRHSTADEVVAEVVAATESD